MAFCKVRFLVGALLLITTFQKRVKRVSQMPHVPEEKQFVHLSIERMPKHMALKEMPHVPEEEQFVHLSIERTSQQMAKKEKANKHAENAPYSKEMVDDLAADKTMGKMPGHGQEKLAQTAGPEVAE